MTTRTSTAFRRTVSASMIREALAEGLRSIKHEDRLTYGDIGRILGKSEDQAAKYCDGSADISAIALYFGKQEWNGRLTGLADKLVNDGREQIDPKHAQTLILHAALTLSTALEDGSLTVEEIRANRSTLENARDAIDAQLSRLKPRSITA